MANITRGNYFATIYINISDLHMECCILFYPLRFMPTHEKACLWGLRSSLTQSDLYCHRRRLEASNFRLKKKKNSNIHGAKTKMLISCAVTAQLICVFAFADVKGRFPPHATHMSRDARKPVFGVSDQV